MGGKNAILRDVALGKYGDGLQLTNQPTKSLLAHSLNPSRNVDESWLLPTTAAAAVPCGDDNNEATMSDEGDGRNRGT